MTLIPERLRGRLLGVVLTAGLGACTADTVPLAGLPCGNEACVSGWVCHPETRLCVRPVPVGCGQAGLVCPSSVSTGDPCPTVGSYLPCVDGVTDCSAGCRTCSEELTWSACSPAGCATCTTYFRDNDSDGAGQDGDSQCLCAPAAPYTASTGGDCDDTAATGAACQDGCQTYYADGDQDGLGAAASTVTACSAPSGTVANSDDCDDGNDLCTYDCTDGDGDDACVDVDCNDGNASCTTDCSACPPAALDLTLLTAAPINPAETVELELSLGGYTANAAAEITCTATRQTILGPITFDDSGATNLNAFGLSGNQDSFQTTPTAPFDAGACSTQARFVRLREARANALLELAQGLDARGYEQLTVATTAAAASSDGPLELQACCNCGAPTTVASISATTLNDAPCSSDVTALDLDDCQSVRVRWAWNDRSAPVGLDDLTVSARVTVPQVAVVSPGVYRASFTVRYLGTFDVTCTWSNPAIGPDLTDTVSIAVE